jgi:hypothetical protein
MRQGMQGPEVFVEDWAATYGSPYLVAGDEGVGEPAVLVEDGPDSLEVHGPFDLPMLERVAFVDGVRRGEATLYLSDEGAVARGVAGAHGSGAVVIDGLGPPRFDRCRVSRMAIFGSGLRAELPDVLGGWSWESTSIGDARPDAPLAELQIRMRAAEGRLAEDLCEDDWLTVVDGPLNFVRSRDLPVVGYVKTHHQPLLRPEHHARVPAVDAGQRTSLFLKRTDIYSAYTRLVPRSPASGPWAGIVRIELPSSVGIKAAAKTADQVSAMLPRFAGVAHVDPRAPQNLQPIGSLERELRHRLGDPSLAVRAVREAVRSMSTSTTGGTT